MSPRLNGEDKVDGMVIEYLEDPRSLMASLSSDQCDKWTRQVTNDLSIRRGGVG